jgi:hypothetical protein
MYFTGYGVTVLWPVCPVVEPGTVGMASVSGLPKYWQGICGYW